MRTDELWLILKHPWWTTVLFLSESKLSGFWQLILDEKKQIFTSEKFLQSASEEGKLAVTVYPVAV